MRIKFGEGKPQQWLADALIPPELVAMAPRWWPDIVTGFDLVGWTAVPMPLFPWRWVRTHEPRNNPLMVIATPAMPDDGKRWLHVSFSRPRSVPSYDDLVLVKDRFIGTERQAITIHPPRSQHVSIHTYCLHLWCCLDGDGLPDFRVLGLV